MSRSSSVHTATVIYILLTWQLSRWRSPNFSAITSCVTHRMWLLKNLALCRVLYLSILMKMWLEGKSVAGKGAHASGIWRSLEKSWFKNLGELHKVGKTCIFGKGATAVTFLIKPPLNQLRHQKVNYIKVNSAIWKSVLESGGREERHRIQGFWGPVGSSFSLCWFRSPCHLLVLVGVCPLWFIKSRLCAALYLLLADTLYGDVNFLFQLGFLPTSPTLPPHHLILLIGQPTCLMLIPLGIFKLL